MSYEFDGRVAGLDLRRLPPAMRAPAAVQRCYVRARMAQAVGSWQLEKKIGAGAAGEVWLGSAGGRRAAVKLYHPEAFRGVALPSLRKLAELHHPNLAEVLDFGDAGPNGGVYVATRYIEGESLVTEVDDRPGGMARLSRALADAGVNIHGHLFLGRWGDRAMFAFVVDKPDVARPILERKG